MTQEQNFPSPQALSLKKQRVFNIVQLVLRVLVPLLTLAATIATLKSDQTIDMGFGLSFHANYAYSSAIRYQTQFFPFLFKKSQEVCVCALHE